MPKTMDEPVKSANRAMNECSTELKDVTEAALNGFREYARSNPETVALWCIGIGFVLGWKLKPW